ncbi:MAG: RNA polymerase sigma factor [Clostridiales bacterium]|nr:RNA polymerase sigma factor [Clostridiales bacterium]
MNYNRIAGMLDKTFAFALSRTFSREEAEELTQEILFQAVKSIGSLQDDSKFEPWFWRLAAITHKVFKRARAKQRATMCYDEVNIPAEDDCDFIRNDEYQNLRRQIAFLSSSYREIIVMHYYDNLPCKAISQILGLPEGTATYRLSLARTKLKERCNMNETALKPTQLTIRIQGEGNYNGDDKPFPWQYINDALSQNILWHSYRSPKTVEELSELTGVPAYYIEDRIDNLVKREAVIQPTKKTVQTGFLIFDGKTNAYSAANSGNFAAKVSEEFFALSSRLADEMLNAGLNSANRSKGELQNLLSVMLLDKFVPDYRPTEYKRFDRRYDGGLWEYTGFYNDGSSESGVGIGIENSTSSVGIGIEKSMNNFESGKLAHFSYHFAPFAYRRMMFDNEIDVCGAVIKGRDLTENEKETAAKLIAGGYLAKDENGKTVCAVPMFTKEQYDFFLNSAKTLFAGFLPHYTEEVKKYLNGYLKLFPNHLKDAAQRNGFHIFVALFAAVSALWLKIGKITLPDGAVCDALIML